MPTVYVTYDDPQTGATTTATIETHYSFRVYRAAALAEGVELPGGRRAIMPGAIKEISLDRPAARPSQEPPGPAAEAPAPAPVRPRSLAPVVGGRALTPELPVPPPQRPQPVQPKPPAERSGSGSDGAAAPRARRTRKK